MNIGILTFHFSDNYGAALQAYAWPGNIRELENVIHYALIVARGARVELDDLRMSPLGQGAGALGSGWMPAATCAR